MPRGIVCLNKPAGITSFAVVRAVQEYYRQLNGEPAPQAKRRLIRVGHAGTLDRPAQGVLLVLLGEATKIADYLHLLEKEYRAVALLGTQTDTDDTTGRIIAQAEVLGISPDDLAQALARFEGDIEQTPPSYSALKLQGRRSSDLARMGRTTNLKRRRIRIRKIELLDFSPPRFTFRAIVSSGTYVRALVRDIGLSLGCGATLEGLVRTRIGKFSTEQAVALPDERTTDWPALGLCSIREALDFLPLAVVEEKLARRLWLGQRLKSNEIAPLPPEGPEKYLCIPPGLSPSEDSWPTVVADESDSTLMLARLEKDTWRIIRGIYADY
ncbi:MAG: tRNA pseudouridine(55) synthase TruB [candidate division WOR-3 bacterium]